MWTLKNGEVGHYLKGTSAVPEVRRPQRLHFEVFGVRRPQVSGHLFGRQNYKAMDNDSGQGLRPPQHSLWYTKCNKDTRNGSGMPVSPVTQIT